MSLRGGGRLLSLRARHLSFLLLLVQLPACTAPPPPEDAPGDDLPASSPLAPPPLPGRSEFVDVSDNRHLRYPVIGREMTAIEAAFGPPDASSDSSATYLCTTCQAGDDPVELVVEEGEVRRVRFNYYVD